MKNFPLNICKYREEVSLTSSFWLAGNLLPAGRRGTGPCLHANDGEHEYEEDGDEHDVADGLDGHDDALHHVLESLGAVDGAEGPQHAQHTEDLHHGDGAGAAMREDVIPGD